MEPQLGTEGASAGAQTEERSEIDRRQRAAPGRIRAGGGRIRADLDWWGLRSDARGAPSGVIDGKSHSPHEAPIAHGVTLKGDAEQFANFSN